MPPHISPTANAQDVTAGRFEVLHNETTDSIVIADTVSHDDIAEVFHNERHTVSQSVYQARETAQLFAASHDLLTALTELADVFAHDGENSVARFDRLAAMFRKDTGYTAPGKDSVAGPVSRADRDGLNAIYDAWYLAKVTRARAAIERATAA